MTAALRVGFIGLGNMGRPMAASLARAGFPLIVRDIDRARQDDFAGAHDCEAAVDLAALAAHSDVVVTMLPTAAIVRQVILAEEGGALAASLRPGSLVIDMSTSDPAATCALGAALAERGVALIDAPVSGAVARAADGTLTVMIGADDEAAVARARPVLAAMGSTLFRTGRLGSGHAMKAMNNLLFVMNYVVAIEGLLIGKKFGLDPALILEIVNTATGRSAVTETTIPQQVLSRAYAAGFELGLLAKDAKIAADLAEELHVNAPFARLIRDITAAARDRMGPARDFTAAVEFWEMMSGVKLVEG